MLAAAGILTSSGGRTSHAALVARQFGKPAVTGASAIDIDMATRTLTVGRDTLHEGEWISIDGTSGNIYPGKVDPVAPDLDNGWIPTLIRWDDHIPTLDVRAHSTHPQ